MWLALHTYRRSPAGVEMMHAVVTHFEAAYNALSGLFPGETIMEVSPKGKQIGAGSGTKDKKSHSGVDLGTKNTKMEKAAVGVGKSQPCWLFWRVHVLCCLHSPLSNLAEHRSIHMQRCHGH